ncbi:MAG: Ig-like domain-containing protein [Oscillospiraceae bacterium]
MKQKILAVLGALALCTALVPAGFAEQDTAGTAPVAENLELTTFRNTSIGGTLSANAPDGSPLTFRITTEPVKGTVTLTDSGTFVYTPPTVSAGATTSASAPPTAAATSHRRRPCSSPSGSKSRTSPTVT